MKIILRNVRCFQGTHEIPIKPLTFLVGENSSGKTTALAMLHAAMSGGAFSFRPDFNVPPFDLGPYDTIASRDSKTGNAKNAFSIGIVMEGGVDSSEMSIRAEYRDHNGVPILSALDYRNELFEGTLKRTKDKVAVSVLLHTGERVQKDITSLFVESSQFPLWMSFVLALQELFGEIRKTKGATQVGTGSLTAALPRDFGGMTKVSALAPIRTRPKRIYETRPPFAPEGDHIPFVLAELLDKAGSGDGKAQEMLRTIRAFGEESGLFHSIGVFHLEGKYGGPLRLAVDSGGLATNIMHVGYGVSQVLPVLLDAVVAGKSDWVLLQQPEVHLHPRAQAALGTLFTRLAGKSGHKMVVETHSDYILDRVRQEVAKGTVPCSDVSFLYFERTGTKSRVYPIALDELGNLVNPPDGYRQFFLEEELSFLTGGGQ